MRGAGIPGLFERQRLESPGVPDDVPALSTLAATVSPINGSEESKPVL
jgi:hypothetical protein